MKGVVFFLLRFLGVYVILSVAYGFYINHYDTIEPPATDPITREITRQTAKVAEFFGYETEIIEDHHEHYEATEEEQTYDSIYMNDRYALSVEEGCNSISIAINFLAFIIGFGGRWKSMRWFLPMGLVIIHVSNLMRLLILSVLNVDYGGQGFHFFHKYGLTAVSYGTVFLLWVWWVNKYGLIRKTKSETTETEA